MIKQHALSRRSRWLGILLPLCLLAICYPLLEHFRSIRTAQLSAARQIGEEWRQKSAQLTGDTKAAQDLRGKIKPITSSPVYVPFSEAEAARLIKDLAALRALQDITLTHNSEAFLPLSPTMDAATLQLAQRRLTLRGLAPHEGYVLQLNDDLMAQLPGKLQLVRLDLVRLEPPQGNAYLSFSAAWLWLLPSNTIIAENK